MAVLYMNVMLPAGTVESDFQRALAPEYVDQFLEQGANPAYLDSKIMLDAPQRAWLVKAVKTYDLDHDGKLSATERQSPAAELRQRLGVTDPRE
jgi:hypothetical protein